MKTRIICTLLLAAILLTACGTTSQETTSPDKLPINLGYTALTANQAMLWYAYENGLLEQYGLDVNLQYITSGTKGVTALLAGDIDLLLSAGSAALNALAAGQDVVLITGFYNIYPSSLVVDDSIKTAEDLKGKAVAVSQIGSSTDAGARIALQYLGLVPDEDVTILSVGDEGDRLKALQAGQVAGALLSSPTTILAHDLGFTELVDLAATGVPYQHTGLVTQRAYLAAHPEECARLVKALIQASHDIKKDPEGAKAVMAEYMMLDPVTDDRALEDAFQNIILKYLAEDPYPTLAGIQTLIDLGAPTNPAVLEVKPEQLVDISILDQLHADGFFDNLK